MVKTLSSHWEGQRFDPWSRKILHAVQRDQKKEKKRKFGKWRKWKANKAKLVSLRFLFHVFKYCLNQRAEKGKLYSQMRGNVYLFLLILTFVIGIMC